MHPDIVVMCRSCTPSCRSHHWWHPALLWTHLVDAPNPPANCAVLRQSSAIRARGVPLHAPNTLFAADARPAHGAGTRLLKLLTFAVLPLANAPAVGLSAINSSIQAHHTSLCLFCAMHLEEQGLTRPATCNAMPAWSSRVALGGGHTKRPPDPRARMAEAPAGGRSARGGLRSRPPRRPAGAGPCRGAWSMAPLSRPSGQR